MQHFGFPELVVVMVVAVLLFGGMNLQEVARRVAESISNFRGGGPRSSLPSDTGQRFKNPEPKEPQIVGRQTGDLIALPNEVYPRRIEKR